jgi:hypothetical protein
MLVAHSIKLKLFKMTIKLSAGDIAEDFTLTE